MYADTVKEMEKQRRKDAERAEREAREKAYREAAHSASFKVFDTIIGTVTVTVGLVFCLAFLWNESKILFIVVVSALALSYIFRQLSKYYFLSGDQKKFETFNKLAGIMGISADMLELVDYQKGKLRGAFSKMESFDDSLSGTLSAVASVCRTGGVYVDMKYDPYRKRCIALGRYVYYSGEKERVQKILTLAKDFEDTHTLPKECLVCVNTLYMYAEDFLYGRYEPDDVTLALACIGALHFFAKPLNDIPDSIPVAGYKDNIFMPLCVTGGYIDQLNAYKDWKITTVKTQSVKTMSSASGELLQKLRKRGSEFYTDLDLTCIQKKQNELHRLNGDVRSYLLTMCQLLNDYNTKAYTSISKDDVYTIVGAIAYWLEPDDAIPDSDNLVGYIDDEIVVESVHEALQRQLEQYCAWKSAMAIERQMDPLIDYLNSVIGDNKEERAEEIDRLASVCPFDNIVGKEERARAVVKQLL